MNGFTHVTMSHYNPEYLREIMNVGKSVKDYIERDLFYYSDCVPTKQQIINQRRSGLQEWQDNDVLTYACAVKDDITNISYLVEKYSIEKSEIDVMGLSNCL